MLFLVHQFGNNRNIRSIVEIQERRKMLSEHKIVVRHFIDDVWNSGKLAPINDIVTRNFTYQCPLRPDSITGREAFTQWIASVRSAFSNFRLTSLGYLIGEGEQVSGRWRMSGVHTGTLLHLEPTYREFSIEGISLYRFADEEISEMWMSYDLFSLMHQLDLTPEFEALER
jgi:predicted ester cyclase